MSAAQLMEWCVIECLLELKQLYTQVYNYRTRYCLGSTPFFLFVLIIFFYKVVAAVLLVDYKFFHFIITNHIVAGVQEAHYSIINMASFYQKDESVCSKQNTAPCLEPHQNMRKM